MSTDGDDVRQLRRMAVDSVELQRLFPGVPAEEIRWLVFSAAPHVEMGDLYGHLVRKYGDPFARMRGGGT